MPPWVHSLVVKFGGLKNPINQNGRIACTVAIDCGGMTEKVKSGRTLSESIKDQPYIMPLISQMAAIGEQSGKMDEMLGKAAQVYEDELDEKIAAISTLIEPILMLALAGMAGVLVGGVLFPIYSLVNSIG